ncbi:hypothetical protein SAY87_009812 [Trapa incisa]|uniref:Uncharacterized protein n=1 Tax=Trapa incisa TaxID=236973 RepID=A0AAN7K1T9_9MYRT|nr:hypothetical protein SAY87_009812 [Trapa incisa]
MATNTLYDAFLWNGFLISKTGGLDTGPLSGGSGPKTFPSEFPYEIFKGMDAAAEVVYNEEEQEEDFLAELTRRLTRSSAPVPPKSASPVFYRSKPEKLWSVSGSPNSTLSGWPPGQGGGTSREGSPGGGSTDPSPPTTPFVSENGHFDWDLIFAAAAGQVARLRLAGAGDGPICLVQGQRQVPLTKTTYSDFCSPHVPSNGLSKTNQYQRVKDEQIKRSCTPICTSVAQMNWLSQQNQQVPSRNGGLEYEKNNRRCSGGCYLNQPQSAWLPMQAKCTQQYQKGPNVRALFLNGSGNIKNNKCAGTGVFLPRRFHNPAPEPPKRPGCSTINPAKVVQAPNLNLNSGDVNPHSQKCFISEYDASLLKPSAFLASQRSLRPDGGISHEVHLPNEWTY